MKIIDQMGSFSSMMDCTNCCRPCGVGAAYGDHLHFFFGLDRGHLADEAGDALGIGDQLKFVAAEILDVPSAARRGR